jgi:hypothetical protein
MLGWAIVSEVELTAARIRELLGLLDEELGDDGVCGEIYMVGGAVMCLVFDARPSTRDVDGLFRPTAELRKAARRVAQRAGVPDTWLNDGAKGFLGVRGRFDAYLDLDHLKVFTAVPQYLLAMKCAAFRIGEGFQDEADVRFLLRALNIEDYAEAEAVVLTYFERGELPQKTWYALQELLPDGERS